MSSEASSVVRIGAGSFATVYVQQSRNALAIKVVGDPSRCDELRKEFEDLSLIHSSCNSSLLFSVPRPVSCFDSYPEFKERLKVDLCKADTQSSIYLMERVWPVIPRLAADIKQRFFPDAFKDNEQAFVSRIYLGKECKEVKIFFNPLNFPLDAKRLSVLALPASIGTIAYEMGRLLSRIHYAVRRDGKDIEFVLGGSPEDPFDKCGFYCIDFNQMRPWENAGQLVDSFKTNDPYYPRPGKDYWAEFRMGYVRETSGNLKDTETAQEFLRLLEAATEASFSTTGAASDE